jgi:transposase
LLAIPGCGVLTAAKLVGETAGATRFRSKSAYARWNGTAPQPASSGNTTRFRLNRGGNRQVNPSCTASPSPRHARQRKAAAIGHEGSRGATSWTWSKGRSALA